MSYTAYTTHDMQQLVRVTRDPDPFWLSNFFTRQLNFDSEYIDFDVVDEGRRLAPFVAPTVQGRVLSQRGYTTKRFKPAYVKPKGIVDPSQLLSRVAGEPYAGNLSPAARRDAIIAQMTRDFRNRIVRRWEWMAAQAVQFGSVTVSGEDYPTVTVSFGRDSSLTATKTSTAAWTHADSTPLEDLEGMIRTMRDLSGYGTQDIIMGTSAWAAFKTHADVQAILETRRGSISTAEVGPGQGKPYEYKGSFGELNIWVYSDKYENDSGTATNYMDPRDVIGVAKEGFQGHRCFGAILDSKAGYQAVDIFAKMWEENDPSAEILLLQSAPLMVPKQPNASFRIRAVE